MRKTLAIMLLLFTLSCSACGSTLQVGVEKGVTPDLPATIAVLQEEKARLGTQQPMPQATAPTVLPAPPGLIYRQSDGLWLTRAGANPKRIAERGDLVLSPDATQALYKAEDDIWLLDLASGNKRNLTNTPERIESLPCWWPGRPGVVVFAALPRELAKDSNRSGFVATVNVDGTGYRVLDDQHETLFSVAPAPDGHTIAYGKSNAAAQPAWLYREGTGVEAFHPVAYGLAKDVLIGSPSWSPDGHSLAWIAGGPLGADGGWRLGLAVFDLQGKAGKLLHLYEPTGKGGWPRAAQWSANSRWLSFMSWDIHRGQEGLWAVRADGAEDQQYSYGDSFVVSTWSPNGSQLAITRTPPLQGARSTSWVVQAGTWELREIDLPPTAQVMAWTAAN